MWSAYMSSQHRSVMASAGECEASTAGPAAADAWISPPACCHAVAPLAKVTRPARQTDAPPPPGNRPRQQEAAQAVAHRPVQAAAAPHVRRALLHRRRLLYQQRLRSTMASSVGREACSQRTPQTWILARIRVRLQQQQHAGP